MNELSKMTDILDFGLLVTLHGNKFPFVVMDQFIFLSRYRTNDNFKEWISALMFTESQIDTKATNIVVEGFFHRRWCVHSLKPLHYVMQRSNKSSTVLLWGVCGCPLEMFRVDMTFLLHTM